MIYLNLSVNKRKSNIKIAALILCLIATLFIPAYITYLDKYDTVDGTPVVQEPKKEDTVMYEFAPNELDSGSRSDSMEKISVELSDNTTSEELEERLMNSVNFGDYAVVYIKTWRMAGKSINKGKLYRYEIGHIKDSAYSPRYDVRLMVVKNEQKIPTEFDKAIEQKNTYYEVDTEARPKMLDLEFVHLYDHNEDYKILYYLRKKWSNKDWLQCDRSF